MSVTIVPTLLQQSIQTNAGGLSQAVREQLGCADSASVDAALVPLQASVEDLETRLDATEALTVSISGDMATVEVDFENLDLAINAQIDELFDNTSASATAGAATLPANPEGFIIVSVNGVNKKLPYYAV